MKSADCSASSGGLDDTLYVVVKKKKTTLCCVIAHQWRSSSQSSSSRKLKRKRSTLGPNFEQHHLSPPLESKKRGVHYLFNYLVKWPIFWKGIICVAFTYYCCWKKWLFWANCQKPRLVNDSLVNKQLPLLTCYFEIVDACWSNNPNYEVLSDRHLIYELLGFEAQISTSDAVFCNLSNTT